MINPATRVYEATIGRNAAILHHADDHTGPYVVTLYNEDRNGDEWHPYASWYADTPLAAIARMLGDYRPGEYVYTLGMMLAHQHDTRNNRTPAAA